MPDMQGPHSGGYNQTDGKGGVTFVAPEQQTTP
jgi:hypothetical protein